MKKILFILLMIGLLSVLTACNKENEQKMELPEMVDVELTINPVDAKPNEPVVFEAKVTQGNEDVKDADEVVFEIWRSKDENHEKIKIDHTENGIYRLEKSFTEEGTYYIISHVTARDMHNMPKREFVVGEPSEPEDDKTNDSMENMEMEDHSHSEGGH